MRLVASVRAATRPEEAARVLADAAGLAPAEARMRLAPEPPALLARLEPAQADLLVAALRGAGLAALAVDVPCPTDQDRTIARAFAIGEAGVTLTSRLGQSTVFEWKDVIAILRGIRASRLEVQRTETTRRFSVGTALATGGLKMTRTSANTVRSSEEEIEQVILVYAADGRAAALAEGQLDFSCLGGGMQPSSTGNMLELARRLREKARSAFYDERLLRLGRRPLPFVAAVEWRSQSPGTAATRTDTSSALDTLAEVMRRAVLERLLP